MGHEEAGKQFSFRLPEGLIERVERCTEDLQATGLEVTRTGVVRLLLKHALDATLQARTPHWRKGAQEACPEEAGVSADSRAGAGPILTWRDGRPAPHPEPQNATRHLLSPTVTHRAEGVFASSLRVARLAEGEATLPVSVSDLRALIGSAARNRPRSSI
jgi:hypothetical protein